MTADFLMTALVVVAATAFDFVNGFHDAANSIATVVATRALTPRQAVAWAALFNFAALFVFGTGVATRVGNGMVALNAVTPAVILCGLLAAVAWGLVTWWKGIPTSSSHALLGGYVGAAMGNTAVTKGVGAMGDAILADGWSTTVIFIVVAPVLGLALAHGLMKLTMEAQRRFPALQSNAFFARAQLASSAFLSLMHGSNDAQKTAGLMAAALVAGGFSKHFTIPAWVLWMSYGAMGLGTLAGGWRIVDTLGRKLARLSPQGGFCAESAAALSILLATLLHLPISTTHVTTGAVLGVGAARNPHAVRWGLARQIVWAWVLTIPAAALLGMVFIVIAILCRSLLSTVKGG